MSTNNENTSANPNNKPPLQNNKQNSNMKQKLKKPQQLTNNLSSKENHSQIEERPLSPISPHVYYNHNKRNSANYSKKIHHFNRTKEVRPHRSNSSQRNTTTTTTTEVEEAEDKVLLTPPSSPEASSRVSSLDNDIHRKRKMNSTYEYNNRILIAKRNGNIRVVMNEFITMKKNNVPLTQHTYNLVLESHAILRKEGTPLTTMLKIYNEMIQANIKPNTYTYVLVIRTLCKRDVEVQKTVAMLKRQSARIGHENEDVGLLEAENNLDKALSIFHEAIADGVSINTFEVEIFNQLLRVLSHYGDTVDATFVYSQLEKPEVQANPNSATYAALINLFGRAGDIDMALHYYDVYRQIKHKLGPHDTSYIFNALVDCHLKCGLLDGALRVVEYEMVEEGIKLTCIPYNSIIRHYCANAQTDEAESLIQRLIQGHEKDPSKFPSPDASSYGPILSAYCQADELTKATHIYDKLRHTDMTKAYGNLANFALLCLSHNSRDKAFDVIRDMAAARLEPDPVLAERIITCFAEANEVDKAIEALYTLQNAMSPRTLSKGCNHIVDSALEVVLHCTSIHQVLKVIHAIVTLVKNNPGLTTDDVSGPSSYVIMCKTLVDSYFEQQQQDTANQLNTEDFQLMFDACFVIYSGSPSHLGNMAIQLLNDMRHLNIALPSGLYHHVLTRLQQRGDIESETRWKLAFNSDRPIFPNRPGKPLEIFVDQEEDDIIIEIAEEEQEQEKITQIGLVPCKPVVTTSTPTLHATNVTNVSKSEAISNDILKAIMNGNSREAVRIFEDRIICRGLIPTPEIMRNVIAVAGKQDDLQTALTMYNNSIYAFKDIRDMKEKDEAIYMATNSLLIGYAQKGDMEKAKVYYDRIKALGRYPDSNGYASMLLGSAKCATDEATDALAIYDEAKRHNVKPTTFFYNVVISKLAKARKLEPALALFEEMRMFKVPANSITYGAIISASVRSGSESQSKRLFGEMLSSSSYQPRVGPFNNMMQFYVRQCPNRDRVMEYFTELRRRHIKPSPHSYKLLMEAYTHIAPYDMPMAHKLLSDMMRCDHLRPQATHYATLIYSYGLLQRDVQSAERVFAEMKKSNIQPDEAVYQAMIDTLISNDTLEKAEQVYYEDMQKNTGLQKSGSPYIENLLIRGYGEKGLLEKAESIFEAMSDDKTQHHSRVVREPSTYEAMIRAYLENDQTEKAKLILDRMIKRDFPPKVISAVADLVLE